MSVAVSVSGESVSCDVWMQHPPASHEVGDDGLGGPRRPEYLIEFSDAVRGSWRLEAQDTRQLDTGRNDDLGHCRPAIDRCYLDPKAGRPYAFG